MQVRFGDDADGTELRQRVDEVQVDLVTRLHADRRRDLRSVPKERRAPVRIEPSLQRERRDAAAARDLRDRRERRRPGEAAGGGRYGGSRAARSAAARDRGERAGEQSGKRDRAAHQYATSIDDEMIVSGRPLKSR